MDKVKTLSAPEFIISVKGFIARRARPKLIYSDNAATFQAAAKWINEIRKDERLNNLLANLSIEWRFNLSRIPSTSYRGVQEHIS